MINDPETCPNCSGRMECIHQLSDTWECDTCGYTVGEYVIDDYNNDSNKNKSLSCEDVYARRTLTNNTTEYFGVYTGKHLTRE